MTPVGTRRRNPYKKRLVKSKKTGETVKRDMCSVSTVPSSLKSLQIREDEAGEENGGSGCTTPKAPQFRIPELLTCPPAPKKRRAVLPCTHQKSIVPFFNSPDLELFFFFGVHDISV